jgi:hypothetical protein
LSQRLSPNASAVEGVRGKAREALNEIIILRGGLNQRHFASAIAQVFAKLPWLTLSEIPADHGVDIRMIYPGRRHAPGYQPVTLPPPRDAIAATSLPPFFGEAILSDLLARLHGGLKTVWSPPLQEEPSALSNF